MFVLELTFSILFLLWYLSFVIGHVLYQENLLLILSRIYQHCFHLNVNILLHLYLVVTFSFRLFFGFWLVGLTISSFLISAHTSSIPSVSPFDLKKYTHTKKKLTTRIFHTWRILWLSLVAKWQTWVYLRTIPIAYECTTKSRWNCGTLYYLLLQVKTKWWSHNLGVLICHRFILIFFFRHCLINHVMFFLRTLTKWN